MKATFAKELMQIFLIWFLCSFNFPHPHPLPPHTPPNKDFSHLVMGVPHNVQIYVWFYLFINKMLLFSAVVVYF